MIKARFLDLSTHGGCSKKATARELRSLLSKVASRSTGQSIHSLLDGFPDVGNFQLSDTKAISTIDVVLPMVPRASDFGRITALHVLSDLYAGLADPAFALAILGVPKGMDADNEQIVDMFDAARTELEAAGAMLVGGHTLAQQEDLFLGFAAVGVPMEGAGMSLNRSVLPDDVFILTKPLGGSLATLRWKIGDANENDHSDVLASMLQSNASAAKVAVRHKVRGCTDVTGYGFLGHLHNLCFGSQVSCTLMMSNLPIFDSIKNIEESTIPQTRQYFGNVDSLQGYIFGQSIQSELMMTCLYDSQVSGGLILAVKKNQAQSAIKDLAEAGVSAVVIGYARKGPPGRIELRTDG